MSRPRKSGKRIKRQMNKLRNKKILLIGIPLLMSLSVGLTSCGTTTANKLAGKPDRPVISSQYQALLMKAGPTVTKEAQKHEWDWQGYADKMENRAGY